MDRDIKIFSFFSGCGILDLGFENSGFIIELVNELSQSFLKAYKYSRQKMGLAIPKYGYSNIDINEYLGPRNLELVGYMTEERNNKNIIGFIGGPPCPDFSIGGKNRGRDGGNGKLSLSYVKLIISMRPDFFMFENVKGLWRTEQHREFYNELKGMLQSVGYCITDRLTNALEFGVPQDRDRIIMIGIQKSLLKQGTLVDFPWDKNIKYKLSDIKAITWPDVTPFVIDSETRCPKGIPTELTVKYWFENNDVDHHPDASRYFNPKAGLVRMQTIQEGDSHKKSYKRIHRWRYSPTVCYGNNEVHLHPYKARRLSVAESMALQSLPKEFCLPEDITLTSCFKTIGNGVPYLMAKGIATTLNEYFLTAIK